MAVDLFIPPAGAMQFELIPNGIDDSPRAALQWADKECDVIWVHMPPLSNPRCSCPVAYSVVLESLPSRMRAIAEMKMRACSNASRILVCNCMGRLIE